MFYKGSSSYEMHAAVFCQPSNSMALRIDQDMWTVLILHSAIYHRYARSASVIKNKR